MTVRLYALRYGNECRGALSPAGEKLLGGREVCNEKMGGKKIREKKHPPACSHIIISAGLQELYVIQYPSDRCPLIRQAERVTRVIC